MLINLKIGREIPESDANENKKVQKVIEKVDIKALLAMGDVSHGEKVFKKCAACRLISQGGENKIGPTLCGIIGRKFASKEDYKYSKAMAEYNKIGHLKK